MQERRQIVLPQSHVPMIYPAIFYDDGETTFRYTITGTGAGYVAEYLDLAAFIGALGLHLKTRAAGAAVDDFVTISKILYLPPSQLIRLQLICMTTHAAAQIRVIASLHWYDGTNVHMARIRLTSSDDHVYYCNGWAPTYADTGLHWNKTGWAYNHLDFSANINKGSFHHIRVNEQHLDASGIVLPATPSGLVPHLVFELSVITDIASYGACYFDQILLTPDNP